MVKEEIVLIKLNSYNIQKNNENIEDNKQYDKTNKANDHELIKKLNVPH